MIAKEWLSLVCQHNKLRVELKKKQQTKAKIATEKAFRKNPHVFDPNFLISIRNQVNPLSQLKLPRIILNKHIEMKIVNTLIHLFLIFSVLTSLRICFPCDVQLPLKFKKVSEKREMGQKQVLTDSHMFRTRNARHSFILSYNLVVKSGEAKIFLLTGHKHT